MASAKDFTSAGLIFRNSSPARSRNDRASRLVPSIAPPSILQPVLHSQPRDVTKIAQIGGKQQGFVRHGDAGDLQVHGANADFLFPQPFELVGSTIIER